MTFIDWIFPDWHWGRAPMWLRLIELAAATALILTVLVYHAHQESPQWIIAAISSWATLSLSDWWMRKYRPRERQ